MTDFIYPLSTVVLNFICLLICIRFVFNRRALWILPMLMSLLLLVGSGVCLLTAAYSNTGATLSAVVSYLSMFLFAISTIWTITIIGFGTITKPKDRNNLKALAEAELVKERTAPQTFRKAADPRPTAVHEITPFEAVSLASAKKTRKRDLYLAGPLPTVRVRKTLFVQSKD